MRSQKTFCRICEAQCGLIVQTEDERVVKIEPNPDHVASKGYACVKGLRMGDFAQHPDRLTSPLKKVDGGFQAIGWEQAISEIAEKLNAIHAKHGGDAIAGMMGNPIGFSLIPSMMMTFFLKAFDSDKLFTPATQDCASKFAGGDLLYGGPDEQTFPDIDHCQTLVIIGSNPLISKSSFISLPHPMDRIKAIEERGGKVWWLNPRRTESANRCGEQVFIRPDTDVFFLLGFLNEVLSRGACDRTHIEKTMSGFEALEQVAKAWTPERCAQVTRVPAVVLRAMVGSYLTADGAALFHSTGVNQGSFGLICYWLQEAINAVSGNLDKRGGVLAGKNVLPKNPRKEKMPNSRIEGVPYVNSTMPGAIFADEVLQPGEGKIRALVCMASNPALTFPDSERVEEALADLDLFVCMDIVRSETAEYADYILPGLHQLERADIPFYFFTMMGLMPDRYFAYTDPVLAPPGEARDESLVFRQICHRAGKPLNGSAGLSLLSKVSLFLGRFSKRKADQTLLGLLGRAGKVGGLKVLRAAPDGILLEPNKPGDYLGQRVATKSGKVDLAPKPLVARAASLEARFEQERENANALKMIQKRERFSHNSWAHNLKDFVKTGRDTNYLYIHADDASARQLSDGDMARVAANGKSVQLSIKIDESIMQGTVALPHGWGHQKAKGLSVAKTTGGVNANLLTPSGAASIEPISGMSHMNGVIVEVSAA